MWNFGEDLWRTVKFTTCSWLTREWTTCEKSCEKHNMEAEQSFARLYFMSHFATWPTRELPAKIFAWMILIVLSSLLYLHYISPYYPWNCNKTFREKTLTIHLRVRDCKTHNHLHNFSQFVFLYSYLSNYKSLRYSQLKHLFHQIWVLREVLMRVGNIVGSHWLADAIWS